MRWSFRLLIAATLWSLRTASGTAATMDPEAPVALRILNPPGRVYAIMSDGGGFLWFGTRDSLTRFDGTHTLPIATQRGFGEPKFPTYWFYRLASSGDGFLWAGMGGGLLRFQDDGTIAFDDQGQGGLVQIKQDDPHAPWHAQPVQPGLPNISVWALAAGAQIGELWIGTRAGLSHRLNGAFKSFSVRDGLPADFVLSILVEANGTVQVGTSKGLVSLSNERAYPSPVAVPVTALARAKTDPNGPLWVGTSRGLLKVTGSGAAAVATDFPLPDPVPPSGVRALAFDGTGALWVGTAGGLYRVHAEHASRYSHLLIDDRVLSLGTDSTGGLWIGTEAGGAVQVGPRTLHTQGIESGVPSGAARSVVRGADGSIWFDTEWGIGHTRTNGETDWIPAAKLGQDAKPGSLTGDHEGGIWFSLGPQGLGHLTSAGQLLRFPLEGREARALLQSSPETLWVGGSSRGLSQIRIRLEDGQRELVPQQEFSVSDGLCEGAVTALAATTVGGIWVATNGGGLARIESNRPRCLSGTQQAPALNLSSLLEEADGTLWVGAIADGGLARLRDGHWTHWRERDGLTCDSVIGLAIDGKDRLWYGCPSGLGRIEKQQLQDFSTGTVTRVASSNFFRDNGLRIAALTEGFGPTLAIDSQGHAWAASAQGAVRLNPRDSALHATAVPRIDEVSLNGVVVPSDRLFSLRAESASLAIHLALPHFDASAPMAFEHILEGYSAGWEGVGQSGVIDRNVAPGRYRFRARARGPGIAPREVSFSFDVIRPWYRQPLWLASLALPLIGMGLVLHRQRLRRMSQRYVALQAERARIAGDLHDVLGQGFTALGLHLEALGLELKDPPPPALDLLQRTRELVKHCSRVMRESIWDLRDTRGDRQPVNVAVAQSVEQARRTRPRGPKIGFECKGGPFPRAALLSQQLSAIALEAVTNAVRHAAAKTISVRLELDSQHLFLTIEDDGIGMDTTATGGEHLSPFGHFGLMGMFERARRMEGTMTLHSAPNEGTSILVEVPLRKVVP